QKDLKVPTASEPAVALLVGYDARAGSGGFGAADSRSDTIMLVRADPRNNTLSLLSFPRDLDVPIYCDPTTAIKTDRINSACSSCFATINLEPGYQMLDGQQALDFVRYRHTDSDFYRLARQQLFLEALKDRLATSLSIFQIPGVIGALKNNVEIGRGSGGAPSIEEIQAYAGLAYHLGGGHLFRVTIPNLTECGFLNAQVCAQPSDIQAAVASFENPDPTQAARANAVALGRKPKEPKQPAPQPAQITTLVLNGTTVPGLARDTSYKLALLGYHTVQLPSTILADAP